MIEYFPDLLKKTGERLKSLLDRRVGLSYDNYTGIALLVIFIIQFITGLGMSLYYQPSPDGALYTIKFMMNEVPFGWLVRSIHYWGGQLFIMFIIVQFVLKFLRKKFKNSFRNIWISGLIGFGFIWMWQWTGEFLTWGQEVFWSVNSLTEEIDRFPVIGDYLKLFIRGGQSVASPTLVRFYVFHTIFFLIFFFMLMSYHIYAVVKLKGEISEKGTKLKVFLYDSFTIMFLIFSILMTLAVFMPREVPRELDLAHPPLVTWIPWYIYPFYKVYTFFPPNLWIFPRILLFSIFLILSGLVYIVLPFIPEEKRKFYIIVRTMGIIFIFGYIVLAIIGVVK